MKKIIGLFALTVLIGCGKTSLNAELGMPFKMTSEQIVRLNQTDIKLSGYTIIEDSRCPKEVNCIWEGQVVAQFDYNGSPIKINSVKSLDTLGYIFEIKSVEPIKKEGKDIPLETYILEVLISK